MRCRSFAFLIFLFCPFVATAQNPSRPARPEEKAEQQHEQARQEEKKAAAHANIIDIEGEKSFSEKELRSQLKEQIATINDFGLTPARADDASFFLELFYRKHGFMKASVHYVIGSGQRLKLQIDEGRAPVPRLGQKVELIHLFAAEKNAPDIPAHALLHQPFGAAQPI